VNNSVYTTVQREILPVSFGFDYTGFSIGEMETVRDAFQLVQGALLGVINRPRCEIDPQTRNMNKAGVLLEGLLEGIDNEFCSLVARTEEAVALTDEDQQMRFCMLLGYEMTCGTSPAKLVQFAAKAFADQIAATAQEVTK
jgi:hypothetical protein